MNGIHDLGGMHGFGPVEPEKDEPVFHADWEKRMLGMFVPTFALGFYTIDEFRHTIERMGPQQYLATSYYEHWLHALETLALDWKEGNQTKRFDSKVVAIFRLLDVRSSIFSVQITWTSMFS